MLNYGEMGNNTCVFTMSRITRWKEGAGGFDRRNGIEKITAGIAIARI